MIVDTQERRKIAGLRHVAEPMDARGQGGEGWYIGGGREVVSGVPSLLCGHIRRAGRQCLPPQGGEGSQDGVSSRRRRVGLRWPPRALASNSRRVASCRLFCGIVCPSLAEKCYLSDIGLRSQSDFREVKFDFDPLRRAPSATTFSRVRPCSGKLTRVRQGVHALRLARSGTLGSEVV